MPSCALAVDRYSKPPAASAFLAFHACRKNEHENPSPNGQTIGGRENRFSPDERQGDLIDQVGHHSLQAAINFARGMLANLPLPEAGEFFQQARSSVFQFVSRILNPSWGGEKPW